MKIAVASNADLTVAGHFGHCENFVFYNTQEGKIVEKTVVPNPGHRPGFLPNFLADNGAEVIIAGGMGGGAVDIFNERGVEVVIGATGDGEENVVKYLKGELVSTGSICHEHQHADECHN
ncbi:MAG: dinitrogenase iron-molybdenum cofactor [Spirochaetales bacterium]|nr:dinitrogenase iron-molybdenum cofactor [Spirochaetales bacterium]